ncbi:MAG TPA: sulfotransferase family 2 domain-containing protein [Acidimicrobiales bacterium]|nr:sulfotransferase family 2 domain-containing protein [Acidimicrobiales bacterium]
MVRMVRRQLLPRSVTNRIGTKASYHHLRTSYHHLSAWKRASAPLLRGELGIDGLALAEKIELARIERHTSWNYHSRASIAHRYVAMTVPKVACTTIKMALQTWEECAPEPERLSEVHAPWAGPTLLAYPTAQIVEMLRSPDYLRFSFVRNPYSRLVSAWKSKLVVSDPHYKHLRASIREACGYPVVDGERSGPIAFRDAVECMVDKQGAFDFDEHWARQVDLLITDVIDYQVVGRFEHFGQEFPAILGRLRAPTEVIDVAKRLFNPTRPMALAAVYDHQLAQRVFDYYIADFETFGYHKNSWRCSD